MKRLSALINAPGLFARQRLLVFWLVALAALAAPWLWLSLPDREPTPDGRDTPVAPEHYELRSPWQAAR